MSCGSVEIKNRDIARRAPEFACAIRFNVAEESDKRLTTEWMASGQGRGDQEDGRQPRGGWMVTRARGIGANAA